MSVVARNRGGLATEVEIDGVHRLLTDEPTAYGGADRGPSPTRMLGAALASCTASTLEIYARRKGWTIQPLEVTVEIAYDGPTPSAFEVGVTLPASLDEEQRRRLLRIAAKCPVHKALAGATEVTVRERPEAER